MSEHPVTRRTFLVESAAAISATPRRSGAAAPDAAFRSRWDLVHDRAWPGPEFWSNPLQDWRIRDGRLECLRAATDRSLHVLTRDLADREGDLRMSVRVGALDGGPLGRAAGTVGFAIGVRGPLGEYRNNLVHGSGLNVGLRTNGTLFIEGASLAVEGVDLDVEAVELRLTLEPEGEGYRLTLLAVDAEDDRPLGSLTHEGIRAGRFVGNLALAANFAAPDPRPRVPRQIMPNSRPGPARQPASPSGRWWFTDWTIAGTKVDAHDDRAFGPILFNHYTLHGGTLKMTAQLPPLGDRDEQAVRLEVRRDGSWRAVAEEPIHPEARTATFRVEGWDDRADTPYRIAYTSRLANGSTREDALEGVVRRDPVDRDVLTVADVSCNAHFAFPNLECVRGVAALDPDLIAFTGDQFYESTGGFGVERDSVDDAILDGLRKWYQHGWTWRDLLRDRPCVSIPDDHDVYHGNLWGEGGAAAPGNDSPAEAKGGYKMMAAFVNVVHRTQTAHHPDSPAMPGKQGITGYFGPLTYGGVSFAILADRQYKSGPDGKVPPTTSGRADHVDDPGFDPGTADLPGLDLLGDPQLRFLEEWADDWRGAEMKAAISQTIFTAMATHHGPNNLFLVADYDTNGWPQSGRDAAVRALRRAFAFHLAGDQHLPAVVQYGLDGHRDAAVAFAGPAVNNLYPRWFLPESPGENRPSGSPDYAGDFADSFGHPMTVLACANPKLERRPGVLDAETDKSSGYGVVRFNKAERTIVVECWPLLADPAAPDSQFPGWPVTVSQGDCGGARAASATLPELVVRGVDRPVVRVIDESSGETLYTLRLPGPRWRPFAFAAGSYTIRVSDPDSGREAERVGVAALEKNEETLEIVL